MNAKTKPFRTVAFATKLGRQQGRLLHLVIVRDGKVSKTACGENGGGYYKREQRTEMRELLGAEKTNGVATCRHCVNISRSEQERRMSILKENGWV